MSTKNILIFAGSLRTDSYNKKFARWTQKHLKSQYKNFNFEFIDLRDIPMSLYDGDVEMQSGVPQGILDLSAKISGFDGLIVSTPEYNGSIPGVLKNLIDWLSRTKPVSLNKKHLLLMAASPGALGGVRSLWHTRVPFEAVGAYVYPEMFGLSKANTMFNESGDITDAKTIENLDKLFKSYLEHVAKE